MKSEIIFLIAYTVIMTILGFWIMYNDKERAKHRKWRIPEGLLFLVSIIGGSFGTWAGMYVFRHKTKHWYFVLFMPLIFAAHMVLICLLLKGM